MEIAQLRYPVAYWDGTPPVHRIVTLAVTTQVAPVQRVQSYSANISNGGDTGSEVSQYAITGSVTGELVHWEIHHNPITNLRQYVPRALLLRMGSARYTCATRCVVGELDVFIMGTVEGFVSVWTATAGRCVRSSLTLPFAPTQLLTFERELTVKVGVTVDGGVERGGRKRVIHRSYVVCTSVQSPYAYICSLPQLKTIKILKHESEIAHMQVANVKKPNPTTTSDIATGTAAPNKPATQTTSASSLRPMLHCLTINGSLHRWDLLDLTAQDAATPSTIHDSNNEETLLVAKAKTPIIKLPLPAPSSLSFESPLFPVCCSVSGSGNLVLVAFQRHLTVFSVITKSLEIPLLDIHCLTPSSPSQTSQSQSASFTGCHFLPSFNLCGVLTLRLLAWSTDGQAFLLTVSSTASGEEGKKKLIIELACKFTSDSDCPPSSIIIDNDRILGGTENGEIVEWTIPIEHYNLATASTISSPFNRLDGIDNDSLTFTDTPVIESGATDSSATFAVHFKLDTPVVISPSSKNTVSSAFLSTVIPPRHRLSSVESRDSCTCSALLTEGSGKIAMLARGFESGLIRVYGPASRSPASPSHSAPATPTQLSSASKSSWALQTSLSFNSDISISVSQASSHASSTESTVMDFRGHQCSITCLMSIGGREYGCHHALLASGSQDSTVCLWDISTATLLKRIRLPVPIHSLHRPALTDDDYQYWNAAVTSQSRLHRDDLHENRIKEEYAATQDAKPFIVPNVSVPVNDEPAMSPLSPSSPSSKSPSQSQPPSPMLTPSSSDSMSDGHRHSVPGVLFIGATDHSLRVYSLVDYSLLQTFRGHDGAILAVFRDLACIREEQVIVQTERHSVYVWSMIDGSLASQLNGDSGAIPFLQKRSIIAPESQLSILAHHLRQRNRQQQRSVTGSHSHGHADEDASNHSHHLSDSSKHSHSNDSEHEKDDKHSLRERFSIRTKSANQLPSMSQLNSISPSNSSTNIHAMYAAGNASHSHSQHHGHATTSNSSIPSEHAPSSLSLLHPASNNLQTNYPVDRRSQHAMLSSILHTASTIQADSEHDSDRAVAPPTPSSSRIPNVGKPTLLKRASSIMEIKKERDSEGDHPAAMTSVKSLDTITSPSPSSSGHSSVTVDHAHHGLHMPLIDPLIGTKKLKHTIDAVRLEGKAHLHVSLFLVNLNRFIRDLERQFVPVRAKSASVSDTPNRSDAVTSHEPSLHHLAVEAIDPTPQEELTHLLTLLFEWDTAIGTNVSTTMLREHFQCHAPFPSPSFAALTDNSQAMTILFPSYCDNYRRWQLDADMTARQALAIASVCSPFVNHSESVHHACFTKIHSHYTQLLPATLPNYVESDLSVLALFSINSNDYVNSSARLLLQGTIERAKSSRRKEWFELFSLFYVSPLPVYTSIERESARNSLMARRRGDDGSGGYVGDQEMITAMVLILIALTEIKLSKHEHAQSPTNNSSDVDTNSNNVSGCNSSGEDDSAAVSEATLSMFDGVAPHVANTLVRVLQCTGVNHANDLVKCSLAADLLTRALPLLAPHIQRHESVIHRLYLLSMAKQPSLASNAQRAMLEFGRVDPVSFLACMGKEAQSTRNSSHVRQSAFTGIGSLIKRHSLSVASQLPAAVSVCVKCLDPAEPAMRKTLLNSSLAALFALDQQYPTVAMHQGTQRFAVAINTPKPVIAVYDLQKAQQVKTIESPRGDVTALAFSVHGEYLASYQATDSVPSVKVWTMHEKEGGSFFGRLIHKDHQHGDKACVKTWELSAIAPPNKANHFYSDAQQAKDFVKWAEEDDRPFRLARSRSKLNLGLPAMPSARRPLQLDIPDTGSAVSSPIVTPKDASHLTVSPLSSPALRQRSGDADATLSQYAPLSRESTVVDLDDDATTQQQRALQAYLSAHLAWKDDQNFTLVRENGEKKSFKLDHR